MPVTVSRGLGIVQLGYHMLNFLGMTQWSVYMLECWDRTLYTGIAIDVEKRLAAHQAGKGAKYTRGRLPVKLVWVESGLDEGDARRREWDIKQLSRQGKQDLFAK